MLTGLDVSCKLLIRVGPGVLRMSVEIQTASCLSEYRFVPHNDVSVNDGPHIRRWSH